MFWAIYAGQPLTFTEIEAWSRLTGERLTPVEAELLKTMSLVATRETNDG